MGQIKKAAESEYIWDGAVDLGILGVYEKDMITIDLNSYDVVGLKENASEKEKINKLSSYYNERFNQLSEKKELISEQFMFWMIEYLCSIQYPFWHEKIDGSYPDYINELEIQIFEDDNGTMSDNKVNDIYSKIIGYDIVSNPDSLQSHDIVRKYLPILDIRKMAETIRPEYLDTYKEEVNFQVSSDICDGLLFCETYGTIDVQNRLEVSHNC